jgi:hypothetical protein
MLQLGLVLRPTINRYASLDKKFTLNLSELEWDAVEALVECLQVFYDATLKLSGTKYPTLNHYFSEFCEVYLSIKKMANSLYPFIVLMGKKMLIKWEKYWTGGNTILALACVLDPRYKMAVVEYYFKELYTGDWEMFMNTLVAGLNELYKEYNEAYSCLNASGSQLARF